MVEKDQAVQTIHVLFCSALGWVYGEVQAFTLSAEHEYSL